MTPFAAIVAVVGLTVAVIYAAKWRKVLHAEHSLDGFQNVILDVALVLNVITFAVLASLLAGLFEMLASL